MNWLTREENEENNARYSFLSLSPFPVTLTHRARFEQVVSVRRLFGCTFLHGIECARFYVVYFSANGWLPTGVGLLEASNMASTVRNGINTLFGGANKSLYTRSRVEAKPCILFSLVLFLLWPQCINGTSPIKRQLLVN